MFQLLFCTDLFSLLFPLKDRPQTCLLSWFMATVVSSREHQANASEQLHIRNRLSAKTIDNFFFYYTISKINGMDIPYSRKQCKGKRSEGRFSITWHHKIEKNYWPWTQSMRHKTEMAGNVTSKPQKRTTALLFRDASEFGYLWVVLNGNGMATLLL